jgi:hypothetical protein
VIASYDEGDFARALSIVGGAQTPQELAAALGLDWQYVTWIAVDASAAVLSEDGADPAGRTVAFGGEAFAAGLLIGAYLPEEPAPDAERLPDAVGRVQARGRHAVIAEHCDLTSVARFETAYSGALVEAMDGDAVLRAAVTRIFEAGLAVGLELGSGGDDEFGTEEL